MMSRQMHLVAYLMSGPTSHHHGMWRHPETDNSFLTPEYWESIARTLEAGKFDAFFFADATAFYSETVLERGGQMSMLDPVVLVSMLARATSHIGLGATISTSFLPPWTLARSLQSADIISGGRVAWNVVTSVSDREANSYGLDALRPRDERYARAEEVVSTCTTLWDSWDEGALVMNRQTGQFADLDKITPIDIRGKYVGARGRFQVPPSPQGHPVIMQAGSSPRGRDFAAKWAEMIFTLQHSIPDMQTFYGDMQQRFAKFGRGKGECAILTSVDPIIGETEEIARAKQAYINDLVDPALGIALVAAHTGLDLSQYPQDMPIADIAVEAGSRGSFDVILQGTRSEGLSLAEAAKRFATSELCPQVVGTAESVADQLQEMFEAGGCDGFILTPTEMPGSFETFTRAVVPILQERGIFRKDYTATTLRGHLREG
jgi:FMN-dependent oxidoreductase (nitrilotriacetate monooxygenase family)